jgi:hypothetical protein
VSYFDGYISYSGLIGIYSYNSHYAKTQGTQNHGPPRWHYTPNDVVVEPSNNSLLMSSRTSSSTSISFVPVEDIFP